MASESTSSQQSSHLSPLSKVNCKCEEGIIAFNNVVALLEHPNVLYHPMLTFLSNSCISTALTKQPSTTYVEYLREFWYSAEETVRAGLATLGLCDKDKPKLSSTILGSDDQMNLNQQTITYYLIWGLEIDIEKPLASEVCLTSHMLKVAELSQDPKPSLILSSKKVNADDTIDKSSSRASMHPVTQSKAPTDLKPKKKKIQPSSQPKPSYKVRVILPKTQVAETQHAEETMATADATKSLDTSESAEEQVIQPKTAEAKKVQDQNVQEEVKESGLESMKDIKIIKSFQAAVVSGSLLIHQGSQRSTSDDLDVIDITPKDDEKELPLTLDYGLCLMMTWPLCQALRLPDNDSQEGISKTFYAYDDKPTQSDPLGHLHKELHILTTKVNQLESSITKQVTDAIQSFVPSLVANTLKTNFPGLLSEALKNSLPQITLKDQLPNIILKLMNREFNAFNTLESCRFVKLQQELSKVIKTKMGVLVKNKVRKGMKVVSDKLASFQSFIAINSQHVRDLRLMYKDMVSLLKAAEVFKKANAEGEKWEKNNPESPTEEKDAQNPDQAKREQHSGDTIMAIA
ncbi:hypothetical protein Tco_0217992 [Tanacetum coccineum]